MTYSCIDCVAPKRHPGCHSSCPDYIAQKAEYDRKKAIENKKKDVQAGLDSQRMNGVSKAFKAQRKMKGR